MARYYRYYKKLFIFAGVCAVALYALPVMSVCLGEGETGTLLVWGYNLMEFSAWGCVPLLAQFLIPIILFDWQIKVERDTRLVFLFVGNMICYVHSLNAARAWLDSLGGSWVIYHPGIVLNPFVFAITLMFPRALEWLLLRVIMRKKEIVITSDDVGHKGNKDDCNGDEDDDDLPF